MRKLFTHTFGWTARFFYIACLVGVAGCESSKTSSQQSGGKVIYANGSASPRAIPPPARGDGYANGSASPRPIRPPINEATEIQRAPRGPDDIPTVSSGAPPNPLSSVDVRPLIPGLSEERGYALYTYLLIIADEGARSTSAICGFIRSRMSETGESKKDDPKTTALYYLPQKSAVPLTPSDLNVVVKNYDEARAASLAARLNLTPSIYLVTYAGAPLPARPRPNDERLDVVEIGGLSPVRTYQYVRAYRDQLSPGGEYWKTRTLRQVGIVVAEQLSLVNHIKQVAGYLVTSAQASEKRPGSNDLPSQDESVPSICRGDVTPIPRPE